MKIAIDARGANWYAGTGIGTYTQQVLKYILKLDTENEYILYWCGTNYKDMYLNPNITISIASKKHHRFFEEYFIPENIKNKSIDIYHVPQNGIGLPHKKNCLYISTIHDLIPYIMPETVGRGYLKRFIAQMPEIIQNSDMIITVSEFSKKDIMRIFDVDEYRIKVTPLAADSCFMPIDKNTAKEFIKNNYSIEYNYILYLGGFSPRKNVKSLIVAYSRIFKDIQRDIKLVILGPSKDDHSYLIELCTSLGIKDNVIFTGFVPYEHLPYFYNASTIFVYPSLYEGFGLPPLEAMSCKVPVITSNISSIPEVTGDGAILINPFDTEDLKCAIERLLENENLRYEIAQKGFLRSKEFSWIKTAKNTLNIYKETYERFK
ncbi:glycosyltransferase family 4 protein [Caloramator sp. E03]|uniref:glycosyltransferase family 4 protein n=1 Tax=Caloramator sp. E03 TaxID=2576307 RepID=UPI001110B357|nr:glycosyltransferase family 1 protein [Caloramator sp. E03]QCX33435.1 glycosyltransferase family 4 protein [Caloramator sp. E03]